MLTFYLLAHIGTPAENILESNLGFILFGLGIFWGAGGSFHIVLLGWPTVALQSQF